MKEQLPDTPPEVTIEGTKWGMPGHFMGPRDMVDESSIYYPLMLDFIVENKLSVRYEVSLIFEKETSPAGWAVMLTAHCERDADGFMLYSHICDNHID